MGLALGHLLPPGFHLKGGRPPAGGGFRLSGNVGTVQGLWRMTWNRQQGSVHYLGLSVRAPLPSPSPSPCARLWGLLHLSTPFLLSEVPMAGEGAFWE